MAYIIIAEDSPLQRRRYREILSYLGHESCICMDGREAVEAFNKRPADLVILDYEMPEMNGLDACLAIRGNAAGVAAPIIIVSAHDSEEHILDCMSAGANDYLVKPIRDSQFVAKIKNFLRTSSLGRGDMLLARDKAVVADRYKIQRILGYGAHSIVFLAEDTGRDGMLVALKMFNDKAMDEEIVTPIIEVAEKLRQIDCEFILRMYDFGKYGERVYLVSEYAPDGDLGLLLKSRRLNEDEAVALGLAMSRALVELAAAGILHMDIKPANIMRKDGAFKLADFGVVIVRGTATMGIRPELWGSPAYIAPEALDDTGRVDQRSDVYSLGVTLYESVTGDNPFSAERPLTAMFRQMNTIPTALSELNPPMTPEFSELVAAMLDKSPERRPELDSLAAAFGLLAARPPVATPAPEGGEAAPGAPAPASVPAKSADAPAKWVYESFEKRMRKVRGGLGQVGYPRLAAAVALCLAASLAIGYGAGLFMGGDTDVPPAGAMVMVMCKTTDKITPARVADIDRARSPSSGQAVGYAMRCGSCGGSFPFTPPRINTSNPDDYAARLTAARRCPHCGSSNVDYYPTPREWESRPEVRRRWPDLYTARPHFDSIK